MRILRKKCEHFYYFRPASISQNYTQGKKYLCLSLPTTALFSLRLQKKIVTFSIICYELEWIIIILHVVQEGENGNLKMNYSLHTL